jgi:hypothetical protein
MPKTAEELEAEARAKENKEEREALAREANKKRNDAMLEARNAIADRADEVKLEEEELEDLTDEVWAQEDGGAPKKTREQRIQEQEQQELSEEEAAAALIREKEAEDQDLDDARDAGADDSRKRKDGTVEYRVGKKWLTLSQLREQAGASSPGDDSGQQDEDGVTTGASRRASPTAAERETARLQAEERRQEERKALRAKLVDLNTRASMGDEEAINELADMQLDAISGDSGRILRMVDERVDARVVGRTEFEKAVEWFESEDGYADVLTTTRLKAEAGRLDAELAKANPDLTPRQRLDRVGKQMRQLREDLGGAPRRDVQRRDTKLDRKRSAAQVPQAAGRQRPDQEPDEQESAQEAIARMARSRGQAHAIKH